MEQFCVDYSDFTVVPNARNEVCYPMALGTAQTVGERVLVLGSPKEEGIFRY